MIINNTTKSIAERLFESDFSNYGESLEPLFIFPEEVNMTDSYKTVSGIPVKVISLDNYGRYPVKVELTYKCGIKTVIGYTFNGKYSLEGATYNDLVLV